VYRNSNTAERKRYVNLVNSVKDSGGDVHIFSSLHVSGEREYCKLLYLPRLLL
jgi:protein pelota